MTADAEALLVRLDFLSNNTATVIPDEIEAVCDAAGVLIRAQAERIVQLTDAAATNFRAAVDAQERAEPVAYWMIEQRVNGCHEWLKGLRHHVAGKVVAVWTELVDHAIHFQSKEFAEEIGGFTVFASSRLPCLTSAYITEHLDIAAPVPAGDAAREFQRVPNALLEQVNARIDELERQLATVAQALRVAQEWAQQIAGDERVCGWVHREDYGLYCLLADCPVNFDDALSPHAAKEPEAAGTPVSGIDTGSSNPSCSPASGHDNPPFPNCGYFTCDLPGQCIEEGKCHHPAIRVPWKNPALMIIPGHICVKCGFYYWEHNGHIIPCPVCDNERLRARLSAFEGAAGLSDTPTSAR